MLDMLKKLCALPGVSGCEDAVRDYIRSEARPFADEIRTDPMGNLIVFKKGRMSPEKKLMLAAHMDEVGIIVTFITDEGYLKFDFVGGIDRRVVIGKSVFIGKNSVPGVIGIKAFHLVEKTEEDKIPQLKDMYIDIGADSREAAEKFVSKGDVGTFSPECVEFGDGMLKAKAIDDRVGCAVLLSLLKKDLRRDTWFVFTVQEEVGCRGALSSSFSVAPDIAVIFEGTTAADLPSQKGADKVCMAGEGPVIPFMDGGTIYDRKLFEEIMDIADKNQIEWQTKTKISGGTDAQAIQRSRAGVRVAAISTAVRYIHSPSSVCSLNDVEKIEKLAQLIIMSAE